MRLSQPSFRALRATVSIFSLTALSACTPQQLVVEKPCPPVEYPVINAPAAAPTTSNAAVARTLDLRLTPARNDAGNVIAIDVAMRFSVPPVDFGSADPIVLYLDSHVAGAHLADRIDDLEARDTEGSLALRQASVAEKDKPARAQWRAERRARGPVTLSYRVKPLASDVAHDEVMVGPGGILAFGRALFLMPATTETYTIHVDWDLQALGPNTRTASSFGGDGRDIDGAPSSLENAIWVAGNLEEMSLRTASMDGGEQFRMVSLGKTGFDVADVGPWTSRVWHEIRAIGTNANEFDLFLRPSGKTGSRVDFDILGPNVVATIDNEIKFGWNEKLSLSRTMTRVARGTHWIKEPLVDEGFGTYIALDTLRRTNLANPADIAGEMAKRSERYFASSQLRTPLNALAAQKDAIAMAQIDDRGLWFAAELDAKLRAKSAGKGNLANFLRSLEPTPVLAADQADIPSAPVSPMATFVKALEKELGPEAVTRYRAVVESATAVADVPDDAFGPCFKKAKKKIQREDAGSKKRESVDGFTFAVVPKLPPSCANVAAAQAGGLQKTP